MAQIDLLGHQIRVSVFDSNPNFDTSSKYWRGYLHMFPLSFSVVVWLIFKRYIFIKSSAENCAYY